MNRSDTLADFCSSSDTSCIHGFVGAVLVGSRVHGEHRDTSDVDCVLIFEEVDERIIPGEFVWVPTDDSFHSIFDVGAEDVGGIQVDAVGRRVSWVEFSTGEWKEGLKHDLAKSRVVFERGRDVTGLIAQKTAYDEDLRLQRLGEATAWLDYHLTPWRLERWVQRAGLLCAHDQLDAAFEELIAALHAYSRTWMPWRYRRLASTLKLAWLPSGFAGQAEELRADSTAASLEARSAILSALQAELLARLDEDGLSNELRSRWSLPFRGLGFAGSMDAWREAHAQWISEQ